MKTDRIKKGITVTSLPYNGTGWKMVDGKRVWYKLTITGRWITIKSKSHIQELDIQFPIKK